MGFRQPLPRHRAILLACTQFRQASTTLPHSWRGGAAAPSTGRHSLATSARVGAAAALLNKQFLLCRWQETIVIVIGCGFDPTLSTAVPKATPGFCQVVKFMSQISFPRVQRTIVVRAFMPPCTKSARGKNMLHHDVYTRPHPFLSRDRPANKVLHVKSNPRQTNKEER